MWKHAGISTGGGMGKQLNYYMGYDEFINTMGIPSVTRVATK